MLEITVGAVAKLSNDDSHLTTLPVWSLKVSVPPLLLAQTVADELTVPPAETGSTVTETLEEAVAKQLLVTVTV